MTGKDALTAYGYIVDQSGTYYRPGRLTQAWREVSGGWLRFEADGSPCPLRVKPDAIVQHGLNFERPDHHDYFDWVWPDKEVARIYESAVEANGGPLPKPAETAEGFVARKPRRWPWSK